MNAARTTWDSVSSRADRNDLPGILVEHWHHLAREDLAQAVYDAWRMPEWPEQHITTDGWLTLFDTAADYQVDGVAADRDADLPEIVTLYRGAIPERCAGMSWTSSLSMATWFAHRFDGIRGDVNGRVWRIDIPREFVLAHFTGRGEDEYVVDTSMFHDEEYLLLEPHEEDAGDTTGQHTSLAEHAGPDHG